MHSLGTRSEGIFGVKRYNSPIYRALLHSLGTRAEDNFLKVFNTNGHRVAKGDLDSTDAYLAKKNQHQKRVNYNNSDFTVNFQSTIMIISYFVYPSNSRGGR